jgi:membrane protease subunit (stomatin/prohibitin family)
MRAAVVGGGAYVAGRRMGRRGEQRDQAEEEQDQRLSQLEQQQAPPEPSQSAPAAPQTSSMVDELNKLAALNQQGVLTDAEFAAAKAKLFST